MYNVLHLAAFLEIIAAGQTLVILASSEGIDLSVGSIAILGAILKFRLTKEWGAGITILAIKRQRSGGHAARSASW